MKDEVITGVLLTLLLVGMLPLALNTQPVKAEPTTIIVPDDYEKIQWAIGNATIGETIYVRSGTYYENVIVDKSVTLVGEDKSTTIIDANGMGTVVYITADDVNITGFTVQGSGYGGWHSGISLYRSSGSNISQNLVACNQAGILLRYSSDNTISDNTAITNTYGGITVLSSTNNVVANNTASNNMYGISLSQELHDSSDSNMIAGNTVSDNEYGISLWYDSDSNSIIGNNVSGNEYGIYCFESSFNVVFHNNFIGNAVQAHCLDSANVWDDGYPSCGNYWSDYTDQDLFIGPSQNQPGSDGIWDHLYVIEDHNEDKYPLVNPWTPSWIPPSIPPSGVFADLIRRKAWPEHHQYDVSKDEDGYQTLYAKVENLGDQTAWVKAVFKITGAAGLSAIGESDPLLIAQGEIAELSAKFGPLTNQDTDKCEVSAFCWYSHNEKVWVQGEKTKTFKFTIVP